ncbi:MAG: DNA-processing protein DprA [Pseudomonadota bacterium]
MDLFSSPPPLAPPTSEGNELSWLRLLRSRRVGPQTFRRLMEEHAGDASAALGALPNIAKGAGVEGYRPCTIAQAQAELSSGRRLGATPLFYDHPLYPDALRDLSDAPPLLWAQGKLELLGRPSIALVGARNASSLGRRMARGLARDLAREGWVIVSGLARGIDAEAHAASLEHGTIAVVAGGVDVIYPKENAQLTADIARTGLILSEMPPGYRPQARHFPRRNRIVAGLAQALVVVEAAAKSGSLITAREAADLSREVFAVPGQPLDARAQGCNWLIRDGATLVQGKDDVLNALRPLHTSAVEEPRYATPRAVQRPCTPPDTHAPPDRDAAARSVLELLGPSPVPEDVVLRDSGMAAPSFAALMTDLELQGHVVRSPGGLLSRASAA